MKFEGEGPQELDKLFIKNCLDKMDKDVATRFVMSALSLSKTKIDEAFAVACREMSIREENKKAKLPKVDGAIPKLDDNLSTQDFLKLFEDILNTSPPPKKDK